MYALKQRCWSTIAIAIAGAGCVPVAALANDWGMGDSNSKIPPSSVFDAVSTPAHEINTVAFFVISITAVIFLIVAGVLLAPVLHRLLHRFHWDSSK